MSLRRLGRRWRTSSLPWAPNLTDAVKTTIYVASTDRADLVRAWGVIRAAFGDHDAPSTLLGVSVLGYPDQLVEIEAIAVAAD